MIKAIQTRYKGYHFRSRLEARWAVFFDALGITWQYEPEGFELPDGTRYLPDFFLPGFDCAAGLWAEVKPAGDSADKARQFACASGQRIVLLAGDPSDAGFTVLDQCPGGASEYLAAFRGKYLPGGTHANEYRLTASPEGTLRSDKVRQAVYAARSARFEHGQSGAL